MGDKQRHVHREVRGRNHEFRTIQKDDEDDNPQSHTFDEIHNNVMNIEGAKGEGRRT